jgi:hypothetical protein
MPVYEYTAFDQQGRKLKGIIDAGSVTAARQKLRETQIFPIAVMESAADQKNDRAGRKSMGSLFGKVGLREVSVMTRQLSTLLGAGLPTVATKRGLGRNCCLSLSPAKAQALTESAMKRAVETAGQRHPLRLKGPFTLVRVFKWESQADGAATDRRAERLDAYTVRWRGATVAELSGG